MKPVLCIALAVLPILFACSGDDDAGVEEEFARRSSAWLEDSFVAEYAMTITSVPGDGPAETAPAGTLIWHYDGSGRSRVDLRGEFVSGKQVTILPREDRVECYVVAAAEPPLLEENCGEEGIGTMFLLIFYFPFALWHRGDVGGASDETEAEDTTINVRTARMNGRDVVCGSFLFENEGSSFRQSESCWDEQGVLVRQAAGGTSSSDENGDESTDVILDVERYSEGADPRDFAPPFPFEE